MDGPGVRPWEILQYTVPELLTMMSEDEKRTYSGGRDMTDAEIKAYHKWYQTCSNLERYEAARRGEL
jgi:hypothetical protein